MSIHETSDAWLPVKPEKRATRLVLAADIETAGLGGAFSLGAVYDGRRVRFFRNPREMLSWLLSRGNAGSLILFHNLEYDLRYFLDDIRAVEGFAVSGILRNERFLALTFTRQRQRWVIADSYALMPAPLASLHVFAGTCKRDIGLADGVIFDPENPEHRDYLEQDVRLLYHAYHGFADVLYDLFQVNPRLTIGSTAITALGRYLPVPLWKLAPGVEEFARKAYFGGLTFLRSTARTQNCVHIDARGMYGYAMRQALPLGRGVYTRRYDPNRPGIYRVIVGASDAIPFTFVPYRFSAFGVAWPYGIFETYLPTITIEAAQARGYDIVPIEGYLFDTEEHLFAPFIDRIESLERDNKANAAGLCLKFLRNSAYGKLAQRPTVTEICFQDTPGATPVIDPETGEETGVYQVQKYRPVPYAQPHMAAWITAHARLNLTHAVYTAGVDRVLAGDTDSVILALPAAFEPLLGDRYGQYKVEAFYREFRAIAPKVYYGITDDERTVIRCKGIPQKSVTVNDLERGMVIRFDSLPSVKSILTSGKPFVAPVERSVSDIARSHGWKHVGDRVIPLHLGSWNAELPGIP